MTVHWGHFVTNLAYGAVLPPQGAMLPLDPVEKTSHWAIEALWAILSGLGAYAALQRREPLVLPASAQWGSAFLLVTLTQLP